MKLVKLSGIAAAVALLSTALGCGNANSFDVAACSERPETVSEEGSSVLKCKEGTGLMAVRLELALAKGTNVVLATEAGSIRCRKVRGEAALEQEDAVLEGEVTELKFGECITGVPFCSTLNELAIDVPIEQAEVKYLGRSAPQAKIVLRRPSTKVSLLCELVGEVRCVYGAKEALAGTLSNPPTQKLRFDATLRISGEAGSCPETATVRMTTDVQAEDLVLDDDTRLDEGSLWVAKTK